jgi:hypothetical protein
MPVGVRSSDDNFRRPRFVLSRETKGEAREGIRGFNRSGLDGQLVRGDGAGVTPASSVSREKRGNGGGDDADRWGPPVGVKRKRKRKRKRKKGQERGAG